MQRQPQLITWQDLRDHASNELIQEWLADTSTPDELTIEALITGLLESYYLAQQKTNQQEDATQDNIFISNVAVKDLAFGSIPSEYLLTKTFQVNARVTTEIAGVNPLIKPE